MAANRSVGCVSADALPSGTVAFLLTDVEGSTRLWDGHAAEMATALARHDALVAEIVDAHGGQVLKTRGEGDSTFSVFAHPSQAVAAALATQQALTSEPWPDDTPIAVRAAVHAGEAELRDGDYFGSVVNRAARVRAIAHGGQVLLTDTIAQLVRDALPADATLLDLGPQRLRDLSRPERVHQLCHPSLRGEFPTLRSLDARSHNLPIELTSFVGRERELNEVGKLLAHGHRLVTLTGMGGSGKTRLALQAAADLVDDVDDGVWLVELASVSDPELVAGAVAAALSVREQPGRGVTDALLDELESRQVLVVLDNCEHVVEAAADLADALLRRGPRLRLLATSRQTLGVPGEATYAVGALAMPEERERLSSDALHEFEALRLFVDRASLAKSDFDASDVDAIARVCRQLDGIPLAIELAAARVTVLSPAQLAERLDDRFRLLTAGPRSTERRQQTLRATLDWSHELLAPDERELFRRLAVFPGGATLDAVESVCGDCLVVLGQLIDKSLVVVEDGRYRMLETVRAYAGKRLEESGEEAEVRGRLLAWAHGIAPLENLDDVDREVANLTAALTWGAAADAESAARLANRLRHFWDVRGRRTEGRGWLERLAGLDVLDTKTRAACLVSASWLAREQADLAGAETLARAALELTEDYSTKAAAYSALGTAAFAASDLAGARDHFEHSLQLWSALGDPQRISALGNLGVLAHATGDLPRAKVVYEETIAAAEEAGQPHVVTSAMGNLATVLRQQGDLTAARTLTEQCLERFRASHDESGESWALDRLARLAAAEGDVGSARSLEARALEISRRLDDRMRIADQLSSAAELARQDGDLAEARAFSTEALALLRELGMTLGTAVQLLYQGHIALDAGETAEARQFLSESLSMLESIDHPQTVMMCVEGAARLAGMEGRALDAARLWSAATTERERGGTPRTTTDITEFEESMAAARAALSDDAVAAAQEEGAGMGLDAAAALAREVAATG